MVARAQSAKKIVAAYERAKRSDPTMTQAEFMRTAYRESGQKPPKDPARYLRKLISGERSGRVIYERATPQLKPGQSSGQFQIEFTDTSGRHIASENLTSFGGSGTAFDIPAIEAELRAKHSPHLERMVETYKRRYAIPTESGLLLDPERFRVRQIRQHKERAFKLVFRTA